MLNKEIHTVVLTLRTGGDFSYRDIDVLARNIRKQWTKEYTLRIICLHDKVTSPYVLNNCIMYPTPYKEWKGWWTKMNLFAPEMEQFRPFLFMDLDTAIVNDISGVFPSSENEGKFIALGNFKTNMLTTELQSGLMWIPAKSTTVTKIWDTWISNTSRHIKTFHKAGDQGFLRETVKAPEAYWQNLTNRITSFKINHTGGWLKEIPNNISIVCFHGFPRIWEASKSINWIKEYTKWS